MDCTEQPRWPALRAGCLLAAALLCAGSPAQAASRLQLSAGSVEWDDIGAHGVEVSVAPAGKGAYRVAFYVGHVDDLMTFGNIDQGRFDCPRLVVSDAALHCRQGRLSGRLGLAGSQDTPVDLSLEPSGALRLALPALSLAGGRVGLDLRLQGEAWRAQVAFSGVEAAELLASPLLDTRLPDGDSLSARLQGSLGLSGRATSLQRAELAGRVDSLSFSNAAGSWVGEALGAEVELHLETEGRPDRWRVEGAVRSGTGQAYLEPVFVDLAVRPVDLDFSGRLDTAAATLAVDEFALRQAGVGRVTGSAQLARSGDALLRDARVSLRDLDLAAAFPIFASPFLVGTPFADLEAMGSAEADLELAAGLPRRLDARLDGVFVDSASGSLSVAGLGGRLRWMDESLREQLAPDTPGAAFESALSWQAARLWGIEFGAVTLPFTTTGAHFRLLEPVLLPVFDGGLAIETLRVRHAGTPQMYLRFDAELLPVSLAQITRALGWPEFGGTVAGRIPRLELADGFVTLGGNLEAQAFGGTVTVRNLRLRDPLGQFPALFADIDVERLDLEQLTGTFDFGMITGRLSGQVEGLEMFDWMPVAFDARFYSTPGDRSPRRISQRAVSDLSRIGGGSGGGAAAALQGGFLKFFDSFRYARLGLSCRLERDICTMDGVAPADNGYYIVQGSGLPRIDVIGGQRRVAWTRLVRQLASISQSPGPVVQ